MDDRLFTYTHTHVLSAAVQEPEDDESSSACWDGVC